LQFALVFRRKTTKIIIKVVFQAEALR